MIEPGLPVPEVAEKGGPRDGAPQVLDRRLYMQLQAFGGCPDPGPLVAALTAAPFGAVLYADAGDPRGVALLTFATDPTFFVAELRAFLNTPPFSELAHKPELTMFGRTYSLGYEPDLADTLLDRPRRAVLNPDERWAVWYPLRRKGAFAAAPLSEQREMLKEHGTIGMAYGRAGLAHDVRLACFGLDTNDNDFVVALTGRDLHPLSKVVEEMRKTRQTSTFMDRLGPFFVGHAVWQRDGVGGNA